MFQHLVHLCHMCTYIIDDVHVHTYVHVTIHRICVFDNDSYWLIVATNGFHNTKCIHVYTSKVMVKVGIKK